MNNKADLTNKEDLAIGVMNLISIEEHLAFTVMKTRKKEYLEVLHAVRKLRIRLMHALVAHTEGELWCISKHLLAATMRQMETANKYIDTDEDKAAGLLDGAFGTYSLFWMLQGETNVRKSEKRKMEKKARQNAQGHA